MHYVSFPAFSLALSLASFIASKSLPLKLKQVHHDLNVTAYYRLFFHQFSMYPEGKSTLGPPLRRCSIVVFNCVKCVFK